MLSQNQRRRAGSLRARHALGPIVEEGETQSRWEEEKDLQDLVRTVVLRKWSSGVGTQGLVGMVIPLIGGVG